MLFKTLSCSLIGYDHIGRRNLGSRSKEEISTCVDSIIWGSEEGCSSGIRILIFDEELISLVDWYFDSFLNYEKSVFLAFFNWGWLDILFYKPQSGESHHVFN